jgi:hypothetical protein
MTIRPPTPRQQLGMFLIGMACGQILIKLAVWSERAAAPEPVSWTARLRS